MANEFFLKQGDTTPRIETILSDDIGPVNLTGTTVKIRVGRYNILKFERTATIASPQVGADVGRCWYNFVPGDTDEIGTFRVEWRVLFPDGAVATFPRGLSTDNFNKLTIQKDIQ